MYSWPEYSRYPARWIGGPGRQSTFVERRLAAFPHLWAVYPSSSAWFNVVESIDSILIVAGRPGILSWLSPLDQKQPSWSEAVNPVEKDFTSTRASTAAAGPSPRLSSIYQTQLSRLSIFVSRRPRYFHLVYRGWVRWIHDCGKADVAGSKRWIYNCYSSIGPGNISYTFKKWIWTNFCKKL